MLGWLLVFATGLAVGRMAAFEERSAPVWGIAAAALCFGLQSALGTLWFLAPVIVLAAAFGALFLLKSRDDGRGGRIVR